MSVFEGFSDEAFTWNNLVLAIQDDTATAWFGQYPRSTAREVFANFLTGDRAFLAEAFGAMAGWAVAKPFGVWSPDYQEWYSLDARAQASSITHAAPGRAVRSALDSAGISQVDVGSDVEIAIVRELSNGIHVSTVSVYETEHGAFAEIGCQVLMPQVLLVNAGAEFVVARFLAIPAVLQAAAFLAEHPFPSSSAMFAMDRGVAYPDVPEHLRPQPFMDSLTDTTLFIPRTIGGRVSLEPRTTPTVIRFGFIVPVTADSGMLAQSLATVCEALAKVNTILEHGYQTAGPDAPAPFQFVLASLDGLMPGEGYVHLPYLTAVRGLAPSEQAAPAPQAGARFCGQCGSPRNPSARFCESCGAPLG